MAERELMERFDMSRPMDQIDNSSTKPLQTEHHGQMSSRRSQSDVRLENCESQARRDLPGSRVEASMDAVTSVAPCQKKCAGRCDDRRHRVFLQRSAGTG